MKTANRVDMSNNPSNYNFDYICEEEIRARVLEAAARRAHASPKLSLEEHAFVEGLKGKAVNNVEAQEAWIQKLVNLARRQGRLMTSRQYADYRLGVRLQVGTPCRYVGLEREEHTENGQVVMRPHGQRGVITAVGEEKGMRVMVFHPTEAVKPKVPEDAEPVFVDLQVREHTPGWLTLEREDFS
jgi:hypothetical protein